VAAAAAAVMMIRPVVMSPGALKVLARLGLVVAIVAAPATVTTIVVAAAVGAAVGAGLAIWANSTSGLEQGRFIADPKGEIVDTQSTKPGSYDQPNGGRTDVLQGEDHGAGRSHTHPPIVNTNPNTGEQFINGRDKAGRPVSGEDVENIATGTATPSPARGR